MRLAAAQLETIAGDLAANLARHLSLVDLAASRGAELVVFPELSLTGYEPRLAAGLATTPDDPRLDMLQAAANEQSITIGAGLPTRSAAGIRITMLVFRPHEPRVAYSKQQLHADELPWFAPGTGQVILPADGHRLAPAICYESLQPDHAEQAAAAGADIYLASVAKSERNLASARLHYPAVARRHGMTVLMANSVGPCDDFVAAGQSAAWNREGELMASLGATGEGIVLFDTVTGEAQAVQARAVP